jgi:hypothetical protein
LALIAWAVHTADRLFDARAGFAPPARLAALGGLLVAEAWKAGQPQALQR